MKSQLAFTVVLVAICSFGAWMLAADAHGARVAPASAEAALVVGRQCLTTGDVTPLLRLVQADDRTAVRELFDRVQRLRQRNDAEVRDFAETSFLQFVSQLQATRTSIDPPTSVAMNTASPHT